MTNSSHKRAIGVFVDHEATEQAIQELNAADFPMEHVSVVGKQAEPGEEPSGVKTSDRVGNQDVSTPMGVVRDAATGAFWGTILVGLTSLAIPGAGPVLAAGSLGVALVSALAGTGAGAVATANLVRALADWGIPQEQAQVYSDHLIAGDYLVIVDGTEGEIQQAESVFRDRGIQDWGIYQAS